MMHWILDEYGEPKREPNLMKWAQWFGTASRSVASDEVAGLVVSTVFLGMEYPNTDSLLHGNETVDLWETAVFREGYNMLDCDRCGGSRANALAMHNRMVHKVKESLGIES